MLSALDAMCTLTCVPLEIMTFVATYGVEERTGLRRGQDVAESREKGKAKASSGRQRASEVDDP